VQIGVLEPKDFSKDALVKLSKIGSVELYTNGNLGSFLENKDVIFIRLGYLINKVFLDKAKKLKYISTPTTGLNHIDLKECNRRGVEIVSLNGEYAFLSTIRATPEHTFGLVLSLLRNYKEAFLTNNSMEWTRDRYKGYELYKNRVGIIGFGRVGKILSKYFQAFDVDVYFYDIDDLIVESYGAIKVYSITELIKKTNIVILSASYTKDNYSFFGKECIDLLKDKYFINSARGELLDELYLIKKLKEDYFKGVAIDVIQNEQDSNNLKAFLKLTENRNLIITPHIAGATYSSMHRTEEFIVNKLENIIGR
jgi:D-3-phosphoglycerate dehydrogenase